ncbi:hypothetical protein LO772_01190 [Yinghuangia sp. ASG 101]|uniref:hypothetical protein n=1 Tax=Yinghuangia sp. ASG 101 TaxID=2896848 RepID=UPI001E2E8312|nr:hypothetical protein [Yinghuangia sp. ASG 101]UGQ12257.1 hypothetical protein LO772_01190 [Yinghuangia sp. ASG 101]
MVVTATTVAAGLMCLGQSGAGAATRAPGEQAPAVTGALASVGDVAPAVTVLRFGEFETDSVLEVDRSINAATGGSGTVGSDREGGPGD